MTSFNITMKIRDFWRRYKKNKAAVVGLTLVTFFFIVALMPSIISLRTPFEVSDDILCPPSNIHFMGTDNLGRDVFSQIVYGTRISLVVGIVASFISSVIGIITGGISGYLGGKFDDVIMRVTEIFQVIPMFFLGMAIVALFGASLKYIIIVIGLLSWPVTARITRAQYLSLKEKDFVQAVRVLGMHPIEIIFSEIFPNAAPPIIVAASLQTARAILMEAYLSFIGLGDYTTMSWGLMLNYAQGYFYQAWWMVLFPGICISLLVLGLNLLGDGLNDALNPRLSE